MNIFQIGLRHYDNIRNSKYIQHTYFTSPLEVRFQHQLHASQEFRQQSILQILAELLDTYSSLPQSELRCGDMDQYSIRISRLTNSTMQTRLRPPPTDVIEVHFVRQL